MSRSGPPRLPALLRPLFWDQDFKTLSWEQDRDLVTARILTAGGWDAVTWLRSRLGDAGLRQWIEQRQGANLTPRQLRFWQLVLDLPARRVDAWVAAKRQTVWERRRRP